MNNYGKKWTDSEESTLKSLLDKKKSFSEIANVLGRTELAIKLRSRIVEYKEIILNRNIKSLVHFTSVWNAFSIGKYGVRSVEELSKLEIEYHNNDETRLDKMLNFISLSISKPNSFLLKEFHKRNPRDWIKFYINPEVIFRNEVYFFYTNAASSIFPEKKDNDIFSTSESFENMFADNINTNKNSLNRANLKRNLNETTCEQAEILIKGKIPTNNILGWEKLDVS